jgi:hypothetical protein
MLYMSDGFTKPVPFSPDIVIAIDDVMEKKIDVLHEHTSQVYEWLPYNRGVADQVPIEAEARKAWLWDFIGASSTEVADRFRARLVERYGPEAGNGVKYAEAFEICEYGSPMSEELRDRLFGGL